ncbi:3,4-dihydroxy-2-butanone-4-phosphate synthase [Brevibacterium jeotgali]|uniref:GTP cyclohydrolase-2 n=1 Tax=Brevibacterium jeotgali TaxID=1262550 RepID=A0A2H1L1P5_9MICO|nr:3,4-dihydroxy-2-butanone-4-phosphate synthase [Brevibacterium jeotgali]TWC01890.1 3,4-dihydroxy 2-butanone 4-phosphate synthase/GTP cyclohydrolase II [Brevibacterium jeotgali]SMY10759.1 3,4-dihydroxy 2-butanone 4-phosphate synthase / GTP cyclohydrolase II [Brevibacterium jeotgali]
MIRLDSIDAALTALRDRRPVVVVDDEDRENEGDLIMPAVAMTPEWMGFMIRHTSGVVCAPMPEARARALDLPPMTQVNEDAKGTAYTLTCDAATGVTTGISAADRSVTVHTLATATPDPTAITRPGHVLPLIARDGGVRERPGHTEAGVELCRLVDSGEVAVIAELVHDAGPMMRGEDLRTFADAHDLPLVSIADLIVHLDARDGDAVSTVPEDDAPTAPEVVGTEPVALPTPQGTFLTRAWRELDSAGRPGIEHLTLEAVAPASADTPLVRVHSECLTGDAFGSHRCDCGEQLETSLDLVAQHGGVVVYVRGHEGRGIGLWEKIRAYALQETGADTVDANLRLGHPEDARDYRAAAAILSALGVERVRLLTNNPAKIRALEVLGVEVAERIPVETTARPQNARYLDTKRTRMQHFLGGGTTASASGSPSSPPSGSPSGGSIPADSTPSDRKAS